MPTVISLLYLFLYIVIGFLYLFGLGWLMVGPILHGSLYKSRRNIRPLHEIPLLIICGLIINYALALIFRSLTISFILGGIISLSGLVFFAFHFRRFRRDLTFSAAEGNQLVGAGFVLAILLILIFHEPLVDWDARSMWFLFAKMIYASGSLGMQAGWMHPSLAWSSVDYPKLVPLLAAQVMTLAGYWNEFLPKLSLFFMYVPAVILLFRFAQKSMSFLLILLLPFTFHRLLWNGYMDGFLALYFGLSLLLLLRFFQEHEKNDLFSGLACLVLLLYIKNEGYLAFLAGSGGLALMTVLSGKLSVSRICCRENAKYFLAGIFLLLPFFLWEFFKQQWGLHNHLEIGSAQSFVRIAERLGDGSFKFVVREMFKQVETPLLICFVLYFVSLRVNQSPLKTTAGLLAVALIYSAGIFIVYLLTPQELVWQVDTSVSRTMLSVSACLYIACYYFLKSIENRYET